MSHSFRLSVALALAAGVLPTQETARAVADDKKIDLAVLYVGSPDGPRTADFVAFLSSHFIRVGKTVYATFRAEEADPFDVVVLDVEMHPSENSIGIGPQPKLPPDYARATVLVNGPGVIVARQLGSKIDWW